MITEFDHKLDGVGLFDHQRPHVFYVALNGETVSQLTLGPYRHKDLAVNPDGDTLYVTS